MAITTKSLLRISMAVRSLRSLDNYVVTKRFIKTSTCCSTNYDKELLVVPRPHLLYNNTQDLSDATAIQHSLKNCKAPEEIFSIIRGNHDNMSGKDTIIALNVLSYFEKGKVTEKSGANMHKTDEFLTLCKLLKKHIRNIEPKDCVSALKVMIMFGVPTTSVIVQTILQILRSSVNDLPLSNLSFLDYMLTKCVKTPLVEALLIALPVVYENNVVMKLDREKFKSIKSALSYLSPRTKNSEVMNVLLHALKHCKEPIDSHAAKAVLWSLCNLQFYTNELPTVLQDMQAILAQDMTVLYPKSIITLIHKISRKVREGEFYYYHEGFADACASTAVSEAWSFPQAMILLSDLVALGHMHIPLFDYIAGMCFEDPALLETSPPHYTANLVNACSAADYKPVFWESIQKAVMSNRLLDTTTIRCPASKIAVSLLALDCYYPEFLEKVFQQPENTLQRSGQKHRILRLYQAVKTLYPQYDGVLPTNTVLELLDNQFIREFPMLEALESALGGSSYVLSNVKSKLSHLIDHVIAMGNDGFPIEIGNFVKNDEMDAEKTSMRLDDIAPPAGSQVILLLHVPLKAYSINTQRMKGHWVLQIKTLEALTGYPVIPVRSTMWRQLDANDQISYIMQAIKLKCEERSVLAQS